jgi:hypothetical protein
MNNEKQVNVNHMEHNFIEPSLLGTLQRRIGRDFFRYRTSRVVLQTGLESVCKCGGGVAQVLVEGNGTIFSKDSGRSC